MQFFVNNFQMQKERTNPSRLVRPVFVALATILMCTCIDPLVRLLYHFLYHFGVKMHQDLYGFIEIHFFIDLAKAL